MNPDQQHQAALSRALGLQADELRARLIVTDYQLPSYLASEVLVSLIRLRQWAGNSLESAIVEILNRRIATLAGRFVAKNSKLRQGETFAEEAVNEVWLAILKTEDPVGASYAEVRFMPFVSARLIDLARRTLVQDRDTVATAEIAAAKHDGENVPFEESLPGDADDSPENVLERTQLTGRLTRELSKLSKKERNAVYFRLECGYEWQKISELMDCSIPTARKHYKEGYARLNMTMDG